MTSGPLRMGSASSTSSRSGCSTTVTPMASAPLSSSATTTCTPASTSSSAILLRIHSRRCTSTARGRAAQQLGPAAQLLLGPREQGRLLAAPRLQAPVEVEPHLAGEPAQVGGLGALPAGAVPRLDRVQLVRQQLQVAARLPRLAVIPSRALDVAGSACCALLVSSATSSPVDATRPEAAARCWAPDAPVRSRGCLPTGDQSAPARRRCPRLRPAGPGRCGTVDAARPDRPLPAGRTAPA